MDLRSIVMLINRVRKAGDPYILLDPGVSCRRRGGMSSRGTDRPHEKGLTRLKVDGSSGFGLPLPRRSELRESIALMRGRPATVGAGSSLSPLRHKKEGEEAPEYCSHCCLCLDFRNFLPSNSSSYRRCWQGGVDVESPGKTHTLQLWVVELDLPGRGRF